MRISFLLTGISLFMLSGCGSDVASTPATAQISVPVVPTTPVIPTTSPPATPEVPTTPVTPAPNVSAEVLAALNASLDDERKAEAVYVAIMDKFGPIAPFANIVQAERQHQSMVEDLFRTRGLAIPENSWIGRGVAAETVAENCRIGAVAEEENIAMYDRLYPTLGPQDGDILTVFVVLQAASRDQHLPAFLRCAG